LAHRCCLFRAKRNYALQALASSFDTALAAALQRRRYAHLSLRQKIDDGFTRQLISTVPGAGYTMRQPAAASGGVGRVPAQMRLDEFQAVARPGPEASPSATRSALKPRSWALPMPLR
jgi:hypothetical protein